MSQSVFQLRAEGEKKECIPLRHGLERRAITAVWGNNWKTAEYLFYRMYLFYQKIQVIFLMTFFRLLSQECEETLHRSQKTMEISGFNPD